MIVLEMPLPPSFAWKLVLVLVLVGGIMLSACARAPRRPLPRSELRRLVLAALTLYAVGVFASMTHHPVLAGVVYVSGIAACALAAWLSRGQRLRGSAAAEARIRSIRGPPPDDRDGLPLFDWAAFERQFRAYSNRRARTGRRRALSRYRAPPFIASSIACSRLSPDSSGWKETASMLPWRIATGCSSTLPRTSTSGPCSATHGARMNTACIGPPFTPATSMSASNERT